MTDMGVSQDALFKIILNSPNPQEIYQAILELKDRLDQSIDLYPINEEIYYTEKIWNAHPPKIFNDYYSWISYILDGDTIVGYYHGHVNKDSLNRFYNETSHIVIRPDYQGRGLCRDFARYTYDQVVRKYDITYFHLYV